jgi:site-specific recombinase XerC
LQITSLGPRLRLLGRDAVRDKAYRACPVGGEVGRFMRQLRYASESKATYETYEQVLAWLALEHSDFAGLERFAAPDGSELIREFLDRRWGESAPATKQNRLSIVRSFFRWAAEEGRITANPTIGIRGPRVRSIERSAYPRETIQRLVGSQGSLRDQCALQLLARMGLRKNELRLLQLKHVDLTRNLLTVQGKGGKVAVLPLGFADLREDLYLHLQERDSLDEFLIYPKEARRRPMDAASLHRWFKRCLDCAGLPNSIKLHELRHSAADELWRTTGNIVLAQQLLRHESVGTTQAYLHPTREDLAAGLRLVDEAWRGHVVR